MNNIINLFDDLPPELDALQSRHIHVAGIPCPVCGMSIDQMQASTAYMEHRQAAAKAKLERWNQACVGKAQS